MDGSNHPITIKLPGMAETAHYWPKILPWVEEAVAYTSGCYLAIDVYHQILQGELGLWLMMDGDQPVAFAITRTEKHPRRWLMGIPFIGGTRMDEWARPLLKHLEGFARTAGCDGLSGGGREGWQKYGFKKAGIWLVKDIHDGR